MENEFQFRRLSGAWKEFLDSHAGISEKELEFFRDVLVRAREFGGFVAGGLPRIAAQSSLFGSPRGKSKTVFRYFDHNGDVDLFFRTPGGYEAAVETFDSIDFFEKSALHECRESPNRRGYDLTVQFDECVSKMKFQILSTAFGSPKDVVQTFDFFNSMCFVDGDDVVVVDCWESHEWNSELSIYRLDPTKIFLPRINKYAWKHEYDQFTVDSCEKLVDASIKQMENLQESPMHFRIDKFSGTFRHGIDLYTIEYRPEKFLKDLTKILPKLRDENVLSLSPLYEGISDSNGAMDEMIRRSTRQDFSIVDNDWNSSIADY